MIGEKKDFKKARQYMDKISKYSSKFDRLSNEWSYYKLKGDEKIAKKYKINGIVIYFILKIKIGQS